MSLFDRHFAHWPPGLPKSLPVPRTSIYYNLEVSARRYPDKAAIVYYGTELTYAELAETIERLAGFLVERLGVARNDRVLLYLQNSPQYVIAYYAVLRANAVVVPVNPMNRVAELRHIAADTGARAAIVGQELFGFFEPILSDFPKLQAIIACYADYVREETDLPLPAAVANAPDAVPHAQAVA